MKKIQVVFYSVILLAACSPGSGSKAKDSTEDSISYSENIPGKLNHTELTRYYNAINAFYDSIMVRRGFNGAMLVAKNGQVIFEKYHGYFDLEKKDTLTEHSAFHLASVSKTFTAMAVLKLAELGKLKLEDDIKLYFPNIPYNGVTIRSLLNHRSGLPNYLYFMEQLGWDKKIFCDNSDVLDYLVKYQPPLSYQPDTHFSYCNTN
ncbi:MAG TPA: serine hydrolase domain-containing protein, partial [Chitinophagaceae bacterium]|nr:serine hydrolase domain-containing protein [Chitinophagaceae bacterium]